MTDKLDTDRVLSSGEVAAYCKVHFRTVIRWIEKGRLKAYKLPGRGNNRIPLSDFLSFLRENKMPFPADLQQYENNTSPQEEEESEDKAKDANGRVLIVDDDLSMAKSIRRTLELEGYNTRMAHDGFQAGIQLQKYKPSLLTLDLSMPGMDGFAVLEYIRNEGLGSNLRIIVISALDEGALALAAKAGAHRCFCKPFDSTELVEAVKNLLSAKPGPLSSDEFQAQAKKGEA